MAAGLWRLTREESERAVITIIAGSRILSEFPDRVRFLVLRSLTGRGIQVIEGVHVLKVQDGLVSLDDGSTATTDITLLAAGVIPPPVFAESGLPTGNDGGLLVNYHLQSVRYPEIFGGGDCITLDGQPLARVGVYAVRQNAVILASIAAALEDQPLPRFDPGSPDFLLILNMGDGRGIFRKGRWIWQGCLPYLLKNFIDRRFMRKYQLSGELEEEV
jgi:NADH dehydrogenase FAD-containing subunit